MIQMYPPSFLLSFVFEFGLPSLNLVLSVEALNAFDSRCLFIRGNFKAMSKIIDCQLRVPLCEGEINR